MEQFEQCCSKVPATLLRSAIERNSANLEDFISKKSRFVESLSGITVVNWLLGVGDRHLENIMYNYADGTVCNIDWGGALQYGAGELPCARLTRSLLAACELGVLESKLQKIVQRLRNNSTLLLAVLEVSFAWREDRQEKMMYMRGLLQGTRLSYQITKDVLRKSNVKYKEKYIELLDEVFQDFENKESYSVEEQVSCLLRQSTDPRILSVTRLKWEPWL
ncbi:DNA-dependent protein kinase catalytic subunit-like [Epargyreus clarus]|uniref:DNA-dependent protein kinase catalytic subunit-like n=1 Tax=Epargyreus clarus TaxID=520877 RepID=UPI003C2C21B8